MNISFWPKYLYQKDFVVVLTVDFDSRLDEMDIGCSVSRHSN